MTQAQGTKTEEDGHARAIREAMEKMYARQIAELLPMAVGRLKSRRALSGIPEAQLRKEACTFIVERVIASALDG